jgi:hypothetical protein
VFPNSLDVAPELIAQAPLLADHDDAMKEYQWLK